MAPVRHALAFGLVYIRSIPAERTVSLPRQIRQCVLCRDGDRRKQLGKAYRLPNAHSRGEPQAPSPLPRGPLRIAIVLFFRPLSTLYSSAVKCLFEWLPPLFHPRKIYLLLANTLDSIFKIHYIYNVLHKYHFLYKVMTTAVAKFKDTHT